MNKEISILEEEITVLKSKIKKLDKLNDKLEDYYQELITNKIDINRKINLSKDIDDIKKLKVIF